MYHLISPLLRVSVASSHPETRQTRFVAITKPPMMPQFLHITNNQVHSNVHFFTSLLTPSTSLTHTIHPHTSSSGTRKDKLFYAQLIQTSGYNTGPAKRDGSGARISISALGKEVTLGEGDGVFVQGLNEGDAVRVVGTGERRGEVMLFEMDASGGGV